MSHGSINPVTPFLHLMHHFFFFYTSQVEWSGNCEPWWPPTAMLTQAALLLLMCCRLDDAVTLTPMIIHMPSSETNFSHWKWIKIRCKGNTRDLQYICEEVWGVNLEMFALTLKPPAGEQVPDRWETFLALSLFFYRWWKFFHHLHIMDAWYVTTEMNKSSITKTKWIYLLIWVFNYDCRMFPSV